MLSRPYLAALVTVVVVLLWLGFGSGKKPDDPSPSPVNLPIQSPAPAVEHHASTPPPPPPKQPVMETFDVEVFLQTFQAANPTYQDYCVSVMRNSVRQSQFSQDMILFYNFFWRYAVEGRKGFYVDSGANEWKYISNTFFYDVCLGWEGLCIEPDIQYIENLRQHRTCTTLNMCISAEKSQLHFNPDGAGGKVAENGNRVVDCDSLQALLAEKGRDTVDLWSLDVEGYELNVLGTVDFSAVTVKVLLVEDFWTNFCSLDKLLLGGVSGLMKWMKLPIDSIYIHSTMAAPLKRWLWPQYQADWTLNNNYRENHGLGTCN